MTEASSWKGTGVLAYDQAIIRNRMHLLDIPAVQLGPEFIKMAVRGSEPSISRVTGSGVSLCLPDSNLGDRNLVANLGTSCPRPASQGGAGQF